MKDRQKSYITYMCNIISAEYRNRDWSPTETLRRLQKKSFTSYSVLYHGPRFTVRIFSTVLVNKA